MKMREKMLPHGVELQFIYKNAHVPPTNFIYKCATHSGRRAAPAPPRCALLLSKFRCHRCSSRQAGADLILLHQRVLALHTHRLLHIWVIRVALCATAVNRRLVETIPARKRRFFEFSYVCPEPVLVK